MTSLTDMQRRVLDFLLLRREQGESLPSCREICAHLGYASPKAATDHLSTLKNKGYVADTLESSRGYRLTEKAIGIPLLGNIPAGNPVEIEETIESRISLTAHSFGVSDNSEAFFLRVDGDSMTGRQIFDGDLVLIEKSKYFKHGDVVAALIDNESTLKTFIKDKGRSWLRSENPKYPNLIPAWELQIQGLARSVIRLLSS